MTTPPFDPRAHWDAAYAEKGDRDVSWFQETPEPSLRLILATGAAPGDAIVDIGGGASRLVDALLDRGFSDVTVLDLSAEALARARARLGPRAADVTWVVADATRWSPPRACRVWHDRAAFNFLTDADDRGRYAAVAARAVAAGGHMVLGTFAPDGPERCSGLPVQRHDLHSLAAVFAPFFEPEHGETITHRTPAGREQRFHFALLRRTAASAGAGTGPD